MEVGSHLQTKLISLLPFDDHDLSLSLPFLFPIYVPEMPSVDPKHQQAVEKIARIFGLEKGSSALTSLSVLSARRKHEEVISVPSSHLFV